MKLTQEEKDRILTIIKKHFRVIFDDDTENGLDETVLNGFVLDELWEDGYLEEFDIIMNWLKN